MTPYFFDSKDSYLFGSYHPPQSGRQKNLGVLVCYPVGHEYIRCHRLLFQLARVLCRNGVHVFRFDYYGSGDSAGNFKQARVSHWVENIDQALTEFSEIAEIDQIIILGLRLGSNLAFRAVRETNIKPELILCDPVFDTVDYLDTLNSMQSQMLADQNRFSTARKGSDRPGELLGYEYSNELLDDIHHLAVDYRLMKNCQILLSEETRMLLQRQQSDHLINLDENFYWSRYEFIESALVSPGLVKQVKLLATGATSQ